MPLWEKKDGGLALNTDVFDRMREAIEKYQLTMENFSQAAAILKKQIPDIEHKEDGYGNDYFQYPDCGKKYTYRSFDGYCEKCGKRMIW